MGVDLSTYRCRIGSFISRRGADAGRGANDKRGADNGRGADDGRGADVGKGDGWMKFFISLCKLIEFIGSLTFIGMLLLMAGIESNPGPRENPDRTDPRFKNWARVAYGYKYLKDGLTRFISNQISKRHSMLKVDILTQCHYANSCSECIIYTLLPDHGNDRCNQKKGSICLCQKDPSSRKKCPNNFCGHFYHLIINDHVKNSPRWSSTDPKKWYKDELQYAKCFLSIDSSANTVSDLDCADLLTIVINNSYISHSVHEVKSFQQCLEDHNKIFFSSELKVNNSELKDFLRHMIHVLKHEKCLSKDSNAQQAIDDLYKLKENSVQLSDEDIDKLLEKANQKNFIFRYMFLLVEIGTNLLREFFEIKVGKNCAKHLTQVTVAEQLKKLISKKIITPEQAQKLPPIDKIPDSSNFDITMLICLLRNVCGLKPPWDEVWIMKPSPTDASEEADITRLKRCRNWLMHSTTVILPQADLDAEWIDLTEILMRLNKTCRLDLSALIDKARKMDTDKELRDDLEQKLKARDAMYQDVISKLDRDEKRCADGHDRTMKRLNILDQNLNQRITSMQAFLDMGQEVQQGFSEIKREFENKNKKLATITHRRSTMLHGIWTAEHQGFSKIQQEVTTVKPDVANVQQEITKQGVSALQQEEHRGFSKVQQKDFACVEEELTMINQGLSIVQEDVTLIKQGLATVQQEVTMKLELGSSQDRKVIQEKLITIYQRDCLLLQVSPFIEDDNEDLISIYQSPTLHHTVYDSDQAKVKQETISSYEEIFCKDDKTFKRVYITGDAGVGKTSLCKRMCLLWSKSRSGDYAGHDESTSRDIKFLEKFDFLFHVYLGATDRRDMIMMIVDQLFYSEYDDERTDMYKLIKRILNQYDSLIVFDGYDEWNPKTSGKRDCKTPKGMESEKCVFLTMCRPYKLENVRLSGNDIDHQIEMSGIHGLSSKHYVTEMVKYLNKKNCDNKNADQFLEEIKQCKLDDQLCIPMISSHLVEVWWYNQKLTHFSKAFLYGNILEMLFKRAARKFEFSSISPSYLKLPNCFSELDYVNKHVPLLQKVCLLSFNSLFKQDKCASTLVFTKKQLISWPYLFTTDEMDFLCKIGIISKNKVIGCFEDQKQVLSFVHKSFIDFFSALYVSSFEPCNMMNGVVMNWTSLDDVLEYGDFFQFLAGLSHVKLYYILEYIYILLSGQLNFLRKCSMVVYENNCDLFSENVPLRQFKLFQTTVINCFIEVSRYNDLNTGLKLDDFIFDDNSNVDFLKQLLLVNTTNVKSIHSVDGKYYDEFDQIKNLQCLNVGDVLSGDYVQFTECMLRNQSTLQTVCFEGSFIGTLNSELPVRSLRYLTSLSLSHVKMQHDRLQNLVEVLSDNVLFENIKLSRVYCDNHPMNGQSDCTLTLNLPHHSKLSSLYLRDVNILCYNVNSFSLKSITLFPLDERISRCCSGVFNCIKNSQLEHLNINGLHMKTLKLAVIALSDTVNTLPYIKLLTLWWIKLPDDVLLRLHPDSTQVKIELWHVTMSRQCFRCFIESCVNNKSVIKVEMDMCNIDGKTHTESVDNMSEYLTSIPTINISYQDNTRLCFRT